MSKGCNMIVAKIQVSGAIAHTLYKKVIPAGIIGAQVEFEYAEDIWRGLHKTVVFRGPVTKDVVTDSTIVTIPQEVAEKPLSLLSVGVYGVDAEGNLAIPTVWADLGIVRESANHSGDPTTDPSLPVWAQIKGMIGNLEELDTESKENLVAAINEALTKGGGGGEVDPAEIQRIVDEYLAAHPPEAGDDGRGIVSIARTAGDGSPGTTDTYTITYTDGGTDFLTVYNGKNGKDGNDGTTPHIGANGNWYLGSTDTGKPSLGADGATPTIGENGHWYLGDIDTGKKSRGEDGTSVTVERVTESTEPGGTNVVTFSDGSSVTVKNGSDGQDGNTPVKGTDYFTVADKAELVNAVLAALPAAEGVHY